MAATPRNNKRPDDEDDFRNAPKKQEPEPSPEPEEATELFELSDAQFEELEVATEAPEVAAEAPPLPEIPREDSAEFAPLSAAPVDEPLDDLMFLEEEPPAVEAVEATEAGGEAPQELQELLPEDDIDFGTTILDAEDGGSIIGSKLDSVVKLGGDSKPTVSAPESSDSSSSIFGKNSTPEVRGPGSGWFDTLPPQPAATQEPTIPPLAEAPDSGVSSGVIPTSASSDWMDPPEEVLPVIPPKKQEKEDATEELAAELLDFEEVEDASALDLGKQDQPTHDESGINLTDPEELSPAEASSRSSIFGNAATEEASQIDLEALPEHLSSDADFEKTESIDFEALPSPGSPGISDIFESTMQIQRPEDLDEDLAVDMPVVVPDSEDPDQKHGVVEWTVAPDVDDVPMPEVSVNETDFEALAASELAEAEGADTGSDPDLSFEAMQEKETPKPKKGKPRQEVVEPEEDEATTKVRPIAQSEDEEDAPTVAAPRTAAKPSKASKPSKTSPEPEKKPAKKGGALGWIGGGFVGLLFGAGAMAGAHFGGVLPPAEGDKPPVQVGQLPPGQPPFQPPFQPTPGISQEDFDKLKKELGEVKADRTTLQTKAKERETELLAQVKTAEDKEAALKIDFEDAKKQATDAKKTLADKEKDFKEASDMVAAAKKDKADAEAALKKTMTEAETNLKKAQADTETALKQVTEKDKLLKDAEKAALDAKQTAVDKTKEAADATAKVVEAEKKLKSAEDGLASVVKELKANKLIDDKDDLPTAIAKVPQVIKDAATAATSADAKKAAEALAAAKKQVDTLQQDVKKAQDEATKASDAAKLAKADAEKAKVESEAAAKKAVELAKADADKAKADLEKAKKETDEVVKKATETAKADALKDVEKQMTALQKKLDDSTAELKKAMTATEAAVKKAQDEAGVKLAQAEVAKTEEIKRLVDKHTKELEAISTQLAVMRAGGKPLITSQEVAAQDRALASYSKGLEAYHARRYADAEIAFTAATKDYPADARFWYFLGLSLYERGATDDAATAFKKGAELEGQNKPGPTAIGAALERVQGSARRVLSPYRP